MTTDRAHPASPRVLCIGEALVDMIATDPVSSLEAANVFVARNGGAPANVAVALARVGVPSAFCGVVGDDPFGRRLIAALTVEGVDTSQTHLRRQPTTIAFAWKNERGDGNFWLLSGSDALLSVADMTAAKVEAAAAIVVGSVALAAASSRPAIYHAVDQAHAAGIPICFDVNLRPSLWASLHEAQAACQPLLSRSTLLKLSLDDARGLLNGIDDPNAIFHELDPEGVVPMIVLTDGERGCWYRADGGAARFVPSRKVEAVEPTGAGDAFLAALIRRLRTRAWGAPNDADLAYAAAAGALATLRPGAWDGLPTAGELDAFLQRPSAQVR